MITDFEGGLLIRTFDYTYPTRIYDRSRAGIGYNRKKQAACYACTNQPDFQGRQAQVNSSCPTGFLCFTCVSK